MKKSIKISTSKNKFEKDSKKQYIKRIRIYPAFLYSRLDKWLKKMSFKGWHIVHCNTFCFWFEKGHPANKEYFTYGLGSQEGKYSISLRYPSLEKTYGAKNKTSLINSNKSKKYHIVEIDVENVDIETDIGYKELIYDRNKLYLRYFIRNVAIIVTAFF